MSKMKLLLASALSVALMDVTAHAAPIVPSMSQVHGVTFAQWHRGGGGWRGGGWGWGPWPWIGLAWWLDHPRHRRLGLDRHSLP